MKSLSIFLSVLLLTSLLAVISSVGSGSIASYADEEQPLEKIPVVSASTANGAGHVGDIIAVSGNNRFVVWYDDTPGNSDIFFRRSTDNGATWQPTVNLSNNAGNSFFPQIAVSGSNVYVTWQDFTPGNYDILFRRSTDNGATWKAVKNLSTNAGGSLDPQIAASGANVYVTWPDNTNGNYEIFLRRSTDNGATWKSTVNLSNNAGDSSNSQIAVSGSNVYVTWYDNTPGNYDILFKRSTDNGATWKAVKNLSSNAGDSFLGDIAG